MTCPERYSEAVTISLNNVHGSIEAALSQSAIMRTIYINDI